MANSFVNYIPTDHFIDRANERFDVDPKDISQFLEANSNIRSSYSTPVANQRQLVSENGVIFIVNDQQRTLVTCYSSFNPKIHESVRNLFDKKMEELIWQAELSEARLALTSIAPLVDELNQNVQTIVTGDLTEENHTLLTKCYNVANIIKHTFNRLGNDANYYTTYSPSVKYKPIPSFPDDPVESQTTKTTPKDYKPKVDNSTIIKDSKPLQDILKPGQKQAINQWFMSKQRNSVSKSVMTAIKNGHSKTEVLSIAKAALPVIEFNQFTKELNDIIKNANKYQ